MIVESVSNAYNSAVSGMKNCLKTPVSQRMNQFVNSNLEAVADEFLVSDANKLANDLGVFKAQKYFKGGALYKTSVGKAKDALTVYWKSQHPVQTFVHDNASKIAEVGVIGAITCASLLLISGLSKIAENNAGSDDFVYYA